MFNLSAKKLVAGIVSLLFMCQLSFAQTKITGTITDAATKEPLIGVSVQVKGKVIGTITDTKGGFALNTNTPTPFNLVITSIGYETQEVSVTNSNTTLKVALVEQSVMGQEVVVAASRIEESVLQSPVTIEKMDLRNIRETPSVSFYDGIANLKGVDMATQGLLFKSINMRGFGATGNPRTVQLIDGMDNAAPGLNFPVDNIVGMPELDVESVEILPGAASALYGPNALNGLILMNSKSPFLYQGLSATVKVGAMSASNRPDATTPFSDYSIRYAKAFNNKFAFKINLGLIQASDWQSTNYSNLNSDPTHSAGPSDPSRATTNSDYDGVNIYGDENQRTINGVVVSRTGLASKDLIDNHISSFKFNGALHYRITEKIEAIAQLNYGYGSTPYTGTGQYYLKNFSLWQAKLELRGDNFMLRGYTTQENSGDTYAVGLTAQSMLRAVKSDDKWFADYATGGRAAADAGLPQGGSAAYNSLLATASTTAITAGGGNFKETSNLYHAEGNYNFKNQIKFVELLVGANIRRYNLTSNGTLFADQKDGRTGTIPIDESGAYAQVGKKLFSDHLKLSASMRYDKSQNFDGQFSPRVSAVATFGNSNIRIAYQTGFRIPTTQNQYIDLAVPGSGTLIGGLSEFDARYKLGTGVDRNTLVGFSVNPTPYITADVLAKAQAYATAAVTAQIGTIQAAVIQGVTAQVQAGVLAAVTAQVTAGVTAQVNAAVAAGQIAAAAAAAAIQAGVASTLALPATQATITQNVQATLAAPATQATIASTVQSTVVSQVTAVTKQVVPAYALATLPKYTSKPLIPEKIQSIEFGYKGVIGKKLLVDFSYYNSVYKNFIGGVTVVVPTAALGPGLPIESGLGGGSTRAGYSRPANTNQDITVTGWSLALNYSLPKGFMIGGNYANNVLKDFVPSPEVQSAAFNTPENRFNINFGKRIGSGEKFGFNIAYKNQDSFTWQSSFLTPTSTNILPYTNTIVPSISNIDAQVSYKMPSIKSVIKVGGTNLFGNPYSQAYGSAAIGSLYYVSISFDELLNK
jgi:iron complex outermembrane recepter protein